MLKLSYISAYISYSVALITGIFGSIIVSGVAFQYVPEKLRITFGVVLILWGIYRLVYTWTQERQKNKQQDEEE